MKQAYGTPMRTSPPIGLTAGKAGRGLHGGRAAMDLKSSSLREKPRFVKDQEVKYGTDTNAHTRVDQRVRAFIPAVTVPGHGSVVPVGFRFDTQWYVTFSTGQAYEHSFYEYGKTHVIKLGGSTLDTVPAPELALSSGSNYVWFTYNIEGTGKVKASSPEITLTDPGGTLVTPNRPSASGTEGVYKRLMGVIEVSGTATPVWKPACPVTLIENWIPEIKDSGGGLSIYENYAPGIDHFRTLQNSTGDGQALFDLIGALFSFSKIKEATSDPQIRVNTVGAGAAKSIEVKGNGQSARVSADRITAVYYKDGLIISVEGSDDPPPEEQVGWWGTLKLQFFVTNDITLPPSQRLDLKFEAGLLVSITSVTQSGSGEEFETPTAGDENTPGNQTFGCYSASGIDINP